MEDVWWFVFDLWRVFKRVGLFVVGGFLYNELDVDTSRGTGILSKTSITGLLNSFKDII